MKRDINDPFEWLTDFAGTQTEAMLYDMAKTREQRLKDEFRFSKTSEALFKCKSLSDVCSLMENVPRWAKRKQKFFDMIDRVKEELSESDLLFEAQIHCFNILRC